MKTKKNSTTSFYKYKPLSNMEFLLDMILKERLYLSPIHQLNDPMEGLAKLDTYITLSEEKEWNQLLNQSRIASFSKEADHPLMWAHYADGARGCVVEFEIEKGFDIHQVKYHKSRIENIADIKKESVIEFLKYKQKCWSYELEYRYVSFEQLFLPIKVKSITFGERVDKEKLKLIVHILSLCAPELELKTKNNSPLKGIFTFTKHRKPYIVHNDDTCKICYLNESVRNSFKY